MLHILLAAAFLLFGLGSGVAHADEAPDGVEKLKMLGFRFEEPKEKSSLHLGVEYGPNYKWCFIVPSYTTRREVKPGILKYLLEDKSINSLALNPGPFETIDVGVRFINLDDKVLRDLPALTHLKQLRVKRLDFSTSERLAYLKPLDELTNLQLDSCNFTLRELAKLGPSEKLRSVWIDNTWSPKLPRETTRSISKDDILELAKQFPNLERLDYTTHDLFDKEAVEAFGKFTKLKRLYVYSVKQRPLDYTQAHRDAYSRLMAPLKKQNPKLKGGLGIFNINWKELGMRPPVK